jgi:hypothetical protein
MTKPLHSALRLLFFVPCLIISSIHAQNVSVAGATVGNGSYADLSTAFSNINGGAQTGSTIIISITGNTIETTTATLNANDWQSLSILPAGGTYSISGNVPAGLISLYGATNVLIDGLNTGGNSLTIDNAATGSTSTIAFKNDCKNITIQNCSILGSASSGNSGTVLFGVASNTGTGNDQIKIQSCRIDASSGGNPINGIYSGGTSGQENSADSILNSSIANFFNASIGTSGISLGNGNTDWDISGCRFYQTATRTYTVGNIHSVIKILSGNGHSITNNVIGYASAAGTDVYTMDGPVITRFIGIDLSVGTGAVTSVQGNIITAISLSTSDNTSTGNGVLCGIRANTGNVNIGNISGNIIGGSAGADLIVAKPSVTLGAVVGINSATTGAILIKNNIIGGLSSTNPLSTIGGSVYGISVSAYASSMTISDNTIGNGTADNMRSGILGITTANSYAAGIAFTITPATTAITKNKIQNISAYGSNTGGYVRGIFTASATGNTSPVIITGDTITKLTSNSSLPTALSAQTAAGGIIVSVGTNDVIADNVISDIALIGTGAVNTFAVGIGHANGANSMIRNNKISGITNASTSSSTTAPGIAAGILIRSGDDGTAINVINNMISLGTASSNNTAFIGIMANHGSVSTLFDNIYHNTVNITGTVSSGAQPSFCFLRGDFSGTQRTNTVTIKNNIFTNDRTGGTGSHFAIANNYGAATAPATGWAAKACNNNILNANAATIGWWTAAKTFANWKISSAGDSASFSGYAVTYVNPASDLHLNFGITPNVVESKGQTIAAVTTDIDGDVRPGPVGSVNGGALAPDIGADEIDGVMQDLIPPTINYTLLPPACDALDRTLTATIADAGTIPVSGPFQPRVYYRKNNGTWTSSQGTLTAGSVSNGTWTFTLLTANMGGLTTTDSVSYFVIAQDISGVVASNPSAGVVATDVNTITTYPTYANAYALNPVPKITSTLPASVCDSGKVTLSATASAGDINWYTVTSGGISVHLGTSFTTPLIKTTTPYYIDASFNGCTSARSTIVATVNHSTPSTLITSACDSLKWNGKIYKTSGIYLDTIPTTKGCDSIMTLELTIKHHSVSTQTIKACDTYPWNGNVYTTSGVYTGTIPNKAGCDSLMTLNLTINHTTTSSESQTACNTYTWRGKTYTTSGTYKDTIPNKKGCDSISSLNLTINQTTTSSESQTACNTYTWRGKTYTTSGTYKDTIPNKKGCDSILSLALTINHSSTATQTIKACDTYTWNGTVYSTSGTYNKTITNKAGCDSLMTLNLTINHSSTSLETKTACDTYTWRGKIYTASGTYKDTVPNTAGCDSILSLGLTINNSSASTRTENACGPYTWNGTVYTTSGTFTKTIPNKVGCDSVMTLHLTITHLNPTVKVNGTTITADSAGLSYQWISCSNDKPIIPGAIGQSYTPAGSGTYAVVETKNGCVDTSNCVAIVVTGIIEPEKNTVLLYPNPGNGLYTLALPEQAQIKIVSVTGAIVFDQRLSKGDHMLDLLNITNGVYLMQVYTNQTVSVFKLIKQE